MKNVVNLTAELLSLKKAISLWNTTLDLNIFIILINLAILKSLYSLGNLAILIKS